MSTAIQREAGVRSGFKTTTGLAALACAFVFGAMQPATAESASDTSIFMVEERDADDLKAVFATVRSKDRIEARVRTPGTVMELLVDEGARVTAGQLLAIVTDPKIALNIKALDAQIQALESRLATARLDYDRAKFLGLRGLTPKAKVDQFKTAFEVASNDLKAASAERQVTEEQGIEGKVLAPAAGRVLKVPLTPGSVVMAGESIATIAANEYLLRLELPERHARFMQKGDTVRIGARGLESNQQTVGEGHIVQVFPELQNGRVIADAEVGAIGDYFVGERALVWIAAGKRRTIVVPADRVFNRFGLDYARLQGPGDTAYDVVVQLGQPAVMPGGSGIEILAGLRAGDRLLLPATAVPATVSHE